MKYVQRITDLFRAMHGGTNPQKIVMTPQASLAAGLSEVVQPAHEGIPIEIRLFGEDEVVRKGTGVSLGVFLKGESDGSQMELRSCEISTSPAGTELPETEGSTPESS